VPTGKREEGEVELDHAPSTALFGGGQVPQTLPKALRNDRAPARGGSARRIDRHAASFCRSVRSLVGIDKPPRIELCKLMY
jgi:hypothetical protein